MERITEVLNFSLATFKRCQMCGYESDDICEFRMWNECDDNDKPEPGNVLIFCTKQGCNDFLNNHPRLYKEVPWGQGGPGKFMLICGDCKFRNNKDCTHPNLTTNGGNGLEVKFSGRFPVVRVCFTDGSSHAGNLRSPAVECEGKVN